LIAKALADGAVAGLVNAAMDPRNRFITMEVFSEILLANNQLDSPVSIGTPGSDADARISEDTYRGLTELAAFYSQYTGFDFSQVNVLVQGFTQGAQMTFGNTIAIPTDSWTRESDGRLSLSEHSQQVTAFHECTHILQQIVYGERVNAFIDQGFHIHASGDRNLAYRVTEDMFDNMDSIHDLSEHWEQQAELLEQSLRLLWARGESLGTHNRAAVEAYSPGMSINVAGGTINLTPERWAKMVQFVNEWGEASRRALGATGGRYTYSGTHNPI
jgi:hypothetical protein